MTVADARFAKPIDAGLMAQLAAEHDLLVTVEEGVLAGGFGSAVWETLNETGRRRRDPDLRVGLPDRYVTHGKPALLHEEVGFTGERIAERVAAAISDRGQGRERSGDGIARRRLADRGRQKDGWGCLRGRRRRPACERGRRAARPCAPVARRGTGRSKKRPAGERAVSGRRDAGGE